MPPFPDALGADIPGHTALKKHRLHPVSIHFRSRRGAVLRKVSPAIFPASAFIPFLSSYPQIFSFLPAEKRFACLPKQDRRIEKGFETDVGFIYIKFFYTRARAALRSGIPPTICRVALRARRTEDTTAPEGGCRDFSMEHVAPSAGRTHLLDD